MRFEGMLYVCSSCGRHVRVTDAACPFCGTKAHRTTFVAVPARLGRSALIALAATACGGPNCPPQQQQQTPATQIVQLEDGGTQVVPMPIAIYGTAPPCH